MPALATPDDGRPSRGGRPRDPSRDGAIRAAILRVLAAEGYAALTMDAVATEAGVGKATIYRRWRTKTELVADAVVALGDEFTVVADGGSLEEDLRQLMRWLVTAVNGPIGAATRSLLSAMAHEPKLRAAFLAGPMEHWQGAFAQVWERAEERGEVRPGLAGTAVAATASAAILQRWLFGLEPVDQAFADEVLADVVLPLVAVTCRCSADLRPGDPDRATRPGRAWVHQPRVPGSPLNGPTTSEVTQPP